MAELNTRSLAAQISGPVPSPRIKGMTGFSGTFSFPLAIEIFPPAGGVTSLYDMFRKERDGTRQGREEQARVVGKSFTLECWMGASHSGRSEGAFNKPSDFVGDDVRSLTGLVQRKSETPYVVSYVVGRALDRG
jgi:hypothetical protein